MIIGIGNPNAQTAIPGLRTTNAPITPKIAPLAPKELG